ncbi:MAG: tyrosine-type recombinase/integrase [Bacteroidaceae bacterium]|nr:tyrosine-type recombinase/integrase [Bacteroidaceae bacterium]
MWTDSFLEYLEAERNYSSATIESYAKDLAEFQDFMEGQNPDASWASAQSDDVREWVIYLLDEQRLAASSVNRKLSALRSFYKYLRRMGRVSVNPMEKVTAPKKRKPLPHFVRESEMDRLLELTKEDRSFVGIRDRLVLMVFYETGIRRAELLGMTDASVDLAAQQIKVTGKRNKQRIVPFGEELAREFEAYLNAREELQGVKDPMLFVNENGAAVTESQVSNLVKKYLSMVTTIEKKSPHVLRHSFATAMLNNHADLTSIQKLLGHESVATTEIYTHVSFEDLKSEYKNAHPRR